MFLKNGALLISSKITNKMVTVTSRNGVEETFQDPSISYFSPVTSDGTQGTNCKLSTSTTDVNYTNYDLSDLINLNPTSCTLVTASTGEIVYTYGFTNTTGSSITINKIGLKTCTSSSSYNDHNFYIYMEKIVPRVVAPNETFSFTITCKFN